MYRTSCYWKLYYNETGLNDIILYQDHMARYNEHVKKWRFLQTDVKKLRALFPDFNRERTLDGAFVYIKQLIGER